MSPTHFSLLIVVAMCCLQSSLVVSSEEQSCDMTKSLPRIQSLCSSHNEALLRAKISTKKCRHLIKLLKCVADNVTVCYDRIYLMYESFFGSPHNCKLLPKHVLAIQKYLNKESSGRHELTTERSTGRQGSSWRPSTSAILSNEESGTGSEPNSTAISKTGGNGDKGYTVSKEGSSKGHTGSNDKDGNAASTPSLSIPFAVLLVISTSVLFG